MPLAVFSLIAMPFGADGVFLWLMGLGVEYILSIAYWVASLPHAINYAPSPPDWGMALLILGGCWFCFWQRKPRWLGIPLMLIGVGSLYFVTPPDMIIGEKAEHIAYRIPADDASPSRYVMLRGGTRSFKTELWAETLGITEWASRDDIAEDYTCDALGCVLTTANHRIAIPTRAEALADDCGASDIILSSFYHDCEVANTLNIERPRDATTLYFAKDGTVTKHRARSFIDRLR